MKKVFIFLFAILFAMNSFAQVGIVTETPQADLHVDGNMQVTKDISVGGTANSKGNSGVENNVLVSQGIGKAPIWTSILKVPKETLLMKSTGLEGFKLGSEYQLNFQNVLLLNTEDKEGQPLVVFTKEGYLAVNKNSSGMYDSFTVNVEGYYLIDLYIEYIVATTTNENNLSNTMTSRIFLNKGNAILVSETASFLINYSNISQNSTQAVYLKTNDVVSFKFSLTSNVTKNKPTSYKINNVTLGVQYLGK